MVTVWASSLYFHEYVTINYLSNNTLKSFPFWQKQFSITIITSFTIFHKQTEKGKKNNYMKKVSESKNFHKRVITSSIALFILLSAVYRWIAQLETQ